MSGIYFAIISAAIFGFQNAAARRAVISATPLQGMILTVPTVVPLLTFICYVLGGFDAIKSWPLITYLFAGAAGVMHFVVGRFSNYASMQALGSTLSTPIQQLSTIASLICAVVFLGETLTGLNILGILLVSIGPALLITQHHSYTKTDDPEKFSPDFKRGALHGLVCVFGYGGSPIVIVLALNSVDSMPGQLITSPFANSSAILLFSYIFASFFVVILGFIFRGFESLPTMSKQGLKWFLLSGFLIAVSQVFRYIAFALAPVSVVVPIQRISVIFRLLFNAYLNRAYERFDTGIVIGIILSVFGAMALGFETKTVLTWLAPGQLIFGILNWQL
jgi:drug/metabolite transporter (DMT)-like permease